MRLYIVVDNPADWPPELAGAIIISARSYLTDPMYARERGVRVFNLCGSYQYQAIGYYVSLLAAARGHRPLPTVTAIQEMKSTTVLRYISDDLDELIQKSLAHIHSEDFLLSIYFGKNVAKHYDRLAARLFDQFEAPLLHAKFAKTKGKWYIQSIGPIATGKIPDEHWLPLMSFAEEYFIRRRRSTKTKNSARYDIAILHNPDEENPPSNDKALKKFMQAAEKLGLAAEMITRKDFGRIAEFDALFIRETTNVHHHTYRFAQRAAVQDLVVIDDPNSILMCTNKVFLAELMERHDFDRPKTLIVHRGNRDAVAATLGFPCILKQPDSSFSQGVFKADDEAQLKEALDDLLDKSDLVIAQEFLPTDYDWRVGVIDGKPIYVCKYYMAKKQWKIQHTDTLGKTSYGNVDTLPIEEAPKRVVQTAVRVTKLIGDGLYGVDLKQVGNRILVIEVNDNPSIDSGFEDSVRKDDIYLDIMGVFLKRIEEQKGKRDST